MKVHIEHDRLMDNVKIYVIDGHSGGHAFWLTVQDNQTLTTVSIPEGQTGPEFITLPGDVWEEITRHAPSAEEDFLKEQLRKEQARVDKLINHVIGA